METTIPVRTVPGRSTTTKVVVDNSRHYMTGFFYNLAFMTLLGGLVLALIAIVRDDLTKMTFKTTDSSYIQYCGWRNVHAYNFGQAGVGKQFTYSTYCSSNNRQCDMEKVGVAWYALLIIGNIFAGLALILFIFGFSAPITCISISALNLLFFACMLADALVWGLYKPCHKACRSLDLPLLTDDVTSCKADWAVSWILVIIAGGLSLLSIISLTISVLLSRKHY
jgi:hypothetical protein